MGIFKDRSNYFKQQAIDNVLIAHTHDLGDGEQRNSFLRLNDLEEMEAGTINYMHFPCMIHFGFDGRYTTAINAVPKRRLNNAIVILQKVDDVNSMDNREDAYDTAFDIVEQILSRMKWQSDTQGSCGPFDNFELARCNVQMYSLNGNLFGWMLSFEDEKYADEVNNYDATKWFQ